MKKFRKINFLGLLQFLGNVIIVALSYYLIFYLKTYFGRPYTVPNFQALRIIIPWILISFIILYFVYRINQLMEVDFYEIFLGIVFSGTILALLTLAFSFFFRAFAFPRSAIIYIFVFQIIFLNGFNFLIYHLYTRSISPIPLLYPAPKNVEESYIEYFKTASLRRFEVKPIKVENKTFADVEKAITKTDFILVDANIDSALKEKIIISAINKKKIIYIAPTLYELLLLNSRTHFIGELPILELGTVGPAWFEIFLKRTLDIIISLIALIFFSPLILIVSILIVIETGFPIFYLQEREGLDGQIFKTIKFRTMTKDAEKFTGPVLSNEFDQRITRVGKFLRKTGIDEIPQFINVLKGEMSVVGPRPERPEIIAEIKENIPEYDLRLNVKPGITGFAQLTGNYDTPFYRKLLMDTLYTKQKPTIITDLFVMLNTVKLFFSPHKRK